MLKNVTTFLMQKNSICGVNPDELVSLDLLVQIKTREDLKKVLLFSFK